MILPLHFWKSTFRVWLIVLSRSILPFKNRELGQIMHKKRLKSFFAIEFLAGTQSDRQFMYDEMELWDMVNEGIQKSEPVTVWYASDLFLSDHNDILQNECFHNHSESRDCSCKQKAPLSK